MTARDDIAGGRALAEERSWRWTLGAVFAVTVARLVWLALDRTDLYPDEAQYWLWSLHPAFGYYSKPPLVAWLIAATTAFFGEDEFAVRLAAPLLHFGTALVVYALARRLYDARIAAWSAIAYATLPGVSASSLIMSTDAPLLFCWAVALYAFVRARESGGGRWWLVAGAATGFGLLAKFAMGYWLLCGLLFLLRYRDERRHILRFLGAVLLAVAIYAPNFGWNLAHGFVSYRHTEDNAALGGALFRPANLLDFFASQFAVFGPLLFAALIAFVLLGRRARADRRLALLSWFALPPLALMLVLSFVSHAQPNWAAPAYIAATVLVVAWLAARGRIAVVAASVAFHVVAAVAIIGAHDAARVLGYELPATYDPLHRLRGWKPLGRAVSRLLLENPGVTLLADEREDLAALIYYVHPHPFDALKWNGDDQLVHDQFDLTAEPQRYIGRDFLLVSRDQNTARILARFAAVGPPQHIIIPLGGGTTRSYTVRLLRGFKGYG